MLATFNLYSSTEACYVGTYGVVTMKYLSLDAARIFLLSHESSLNIDVKHLPRLTYVLHIPYVDIDDNVYISCKFIYICLPIVKDNGILLYDKVPII